MILGHDIDLEKVVALSKLALVGKFKRKSISRATLVLWMDTHSTKMLDYMSAFHLIVKGWLCFELRESKDMDIILSKTRLRGPFSIVFKRWQ